MPYFLRCVLLLGLYSILGVRAEDAGAPLVSSPAVAVSIVPLEGAGAAVAVPPSAVVPTVEAPSAPEPESCRSLTKQAMAADMKAFTAQSQKADLSDQAKLFDVSISLWSRAVALCEEHAKVQAQSNLADSQRVRDSLSEQLGSGQECMLTHKNAEAFQQMARQSLSERHWDAAEMLFHKSENMWTLAAEQCSGSQREIALRRCDETKIDGHNAKYCAPLFEKAREETKKLRSGVALTPDEKKEVSMMAETLWREAIVKCKGSAVQEIALNNAQLLAKERGTPFVAKPLPAVVPVAGTQPTVVSTAVKATVPATVVVTPVASAPALVVAELAPAGLPAQLAGEQEGKLGKPGVQNAQGIPEEKKEITPVAVASSEQTSQAGGRSGESAPPPVTQVSPPAPAPVSFKLAEFNAEKAVGLDVYTGKGKIVWGSGSVYEGDLLKGVRHGKGAIRWTSGQTYEGDWVEGKPEGLGTMKFVNGDRYEGRVVDAIPQGEGRMDYASGDHYVGDFVAGKPNGKGVYVWKNGQQFEGTWRKGLTHGQGRMQYATGETYVGDYVDGEREGQGEFIFPNGDKYVGQWKAGKKNGQGAYIWKSGGRWEGRFANDERTEEGKLTSAN